VPIFRHLVVGLDLAPHGVLSEGSRAAVAHARWLAERSSVRVTLLHSRTPDEFWDPDSEAYAVGPPFEAKALEGALAELRDAGIDADLQVTEERALLALLRAVIQGPCDLVLVGKRALVDAGGPRLGSTAAKLLRKCPCAVWAVRPGTQPPPRRLLAATDLTEVGAVVLQRATQVATRAAAELHVVHTYQLSMAAQLGVGESSEAYAKRQHDEAVERIRAGLHEMGYGGQAELHVALTSPSRAILECVDRLQPDLVVMGTISRGGVAGLLLGNTAERLLSRLDVSLLALKPADFVCPVTFDD
jgi:universal stress protein E